MNKELLVSVIIPVFNNTASEIKRCLDSLQTSQFDQYELIIVDDGSEPDCARLLDQYAFEISKLRVIHQKNQGAAVARNHGAKETYGKYLLFVDADDVVTEQMWNDFSLLQLEKTEEDVIYGLIQLDKKQKTGKKISLKNKLTKYNLSQKEYPFLYRQMIGLGVPEMTVKDGYISRGPIARLVKKIFFMKHLFDPSLRHGEDQIWNLDMLKDEPKAAIVFHHWYTYIYNGSSITHKASKDYIKWQKQLLMRLVPYINSQIYYPAFMIRIFESLREIAVNVYLASENKINLLQRAKEFNKMYREYPFNLFMYKYAKMGG